MSKLERKWWFAGPCFTVAWFAAVSLYQAANYALPFGSVDGSLARYALFFLCMGALQRIVSFAAWFVVVAISPKVARSAD